jgi:hypothetical protein
MNEQSNDRSGIEPQATVVLYDRNSGDVLGYHHFSATSGATIPDRKDMEEIAVSSASRDHEETPISPEAVATLLVAPGEIEQGKDYRVSADRQLVARRPDNADAPSSS